MALRLILFDVDGTLTDSQAKITNAMSRAFEAIGHAVPPREDMLGMVGLSLRNVAAGLLPSVSVDTQEAWCEAYKEAFHEGGNGHASSELFEGIPEVLETLFAQEDTLLGLATGKGRRGLDGMIAAHGLGPLLATTQCADEHPSKPHPSMVVAALNETGVAPQNCVVIGDTTFDMDMARAAGVAFIAVTWGYHRPDQLASADAIARTPHEIIERIDEVLN